MARKDNPTPAEDTHEEPETTPSAPESSSFSIADGPAKDRDAAEVIPADGPDSFAYSDGIHPGEYVKEGSTYHYREV